MSFSDDIQKSQKLLKAGLYLMLYYIISQQFIVTVYHFCGNLASYLVLHTLV